MLGGLGMFASLVVAAAPMAAPAAEPRFVSLRAMKGDVENVLGDPEVAGQPFVLRIRELPGTIIPPHTHPVDENITVLEGTFFFAVADTFDLSLMKELQAGDYAFAPRGSTMFGASPEGAVVQVHGIGPFHIHWRDGYRDLDDPHASEVFLLRKGDAVTTPRGTGRIRQGYASGSHVQYEIERSDGSRFLALQAETRKVAAPR
jgi:quercetin dioxygenase-like cupin family protein